MEAKNNSFLTNLLSILLLISCVVAGFFAYQTQQLVKQLWVTRDELKPTPITTQTPIPTCVSLPTCAYNTDPIKPTCKIGENPPDGGLWCPRPTEPPVACTMEAKLCPDGSSVGRIGPDCKFASCPTPKN